MAKIEIQPVESLGQAAATPTNLPQPSLSPPDPSSESLFNRPPRILRELPRQAVELPSPPELPSPLQMRLSMILAPLLTSGIYLLLFLARGSSGGRSGWTILPLIGVSLVTAGISIYTYRTQRREYDTAVQAAESSFTEALNNATSTIEKLNLKQYELRNANDPDISTIFDVVHQRDLRLWERRPGDDDFMQVRVGIGEHPTLTDIQLERSRHTTAYDLRLQKVRQTYQKIRDVPRCVDFRTIGSLGIVGPKSQTSMLTHALLWQIIAHHSPEDVRIFAFWNSVDDKEWDWLPAVPHTQSLSGESGYRLLAHTDCNPDDPKDQRPLYLAQVLTELQQELNRRLEDQRRLPHLVVLLTEYSPGGTSMAPIEMILERGPQLGASVISIVSQVHDVPGACGAYLNLTSTPQLVATTGHSPVGGRVLLQAVDQADAKRSKAAAQSLAQVLLAGQTGSRQLPRAVRLFELIPRDPTLAALLGPHANTAFKVLDQYDPQPLWRVAPKTDKQHHSGLRAVPIGQVSANESEHSLLYLDLNERKEGVHGMIAGTTGAGKSELLTTLLLGLALLHHPDRLNFMLIDFKGGATFRDLARLPHTAGYITDLSGSQAQRALTAINSELDRRKQRFGSNNVSNIHQYRQLTPPADPIPNLLIAIDEFDEMVNDHEDVVEELIRVAKQGRSLGVHLLFATQQPSNNKIKPGLKANLTYWLSLRVVDPEDSKIMIGNKEAAMISNTTPGRAYKRVDKNQPILFQSALATADYKPASEKEQAQQFTFHVDSTGRMISHAEYRKRLEEVRHSTIHNQPVTTGSTFAQLNAPEHQKSLPEKIRSEAEVLIEVLHKALPSSAHATERFRIWEPPLRSDVVLSELLTLGDSPGDELYVPVGYLDNPKEARKEPLNVNLAQAGSILIIGSAGAGKTSTLRTAVLALTARFSPADLVLYIIDQQGIGLRFAADETQPALLPHIADCISSNNVLKLDRLLTMLEDTIQKRTFAFQKYSIDTYTKYREQLRASTTAAPLTDEPLPAIVLLIDGLHELAEYNPDALKRLTDLIRGGLAYGVYVIATVDRMSSALPSDLRNSIPTRWVLRLNTEDDSNALLNKPFAARINVQDHGRGYLPHAPLPREFQIAYPTLVDPAVVKQPAAQAADADDGSDPSVERDLSHLQATEQLSMSTAMIRAKWAAVEPVGQPVRLLPTEIPVNSAQWQQDSQSLGSVEVGIGTNNRTHLPLSIDFAVTPHLIVAGGPSSGKLNTLRCILGALVTRYTPEQLSLFIVDYRDSVLTPFVTLPHTRGYATDNDSSNQTTRLTSVTDKLKAHLVQQEQQVRHHGLQQRTVVVLANIDLIDQRDITNHLDPLIKWVMQGQRIGVHFLIAARDYSGLGSSRMFKLIKQERCVVVLGALDSTQIGSIGLGPKDVAWPSTLSEVPGRGFLVRRSQVQLGQCWHVDAATLQAALAPLAQPQTAPTIHPNGEEPLASL